MNEEEAIQRLIKIGHQGAAISIAGGIFIAAVGGVFLTPLMFPLGGALIANGITSIYSLHAKKKNEKVVNAINGAVISALLGYAAYRMPFIREGVASLQAGPMVTALGIASICASFFFSIPKRVKFMAAGAALSIMGPVIDFATYAIEKNSKPPVPIEQPKIPEEKQGYALGTKRPALQMQTAFSSPFAREFSLKASRELLPNSVRNTFARATVPNAPIKNSA
jgi:uncharacterized membrane protein HdeD (DUF308 family)